MPSPIASHMHTQIVSQKEPPILNPKTTAVLVRFLLFFAIGEVPVLTAWLSTPALDYRLLAIGLLTGLGGALEKLYSPQLASVILPNAQIMPHEPVPATPLLDTLPPQIITLPDPPPEPVVPPEG